MPTPNLGLPYIAQGQAQKEVTHNDALNLLDAVVQLAVLDRDLATPPGSPTQGARYLVAASPTGAWVGHANHIAVFLDGAWNFFVPNTGWLAWVVDEGVMLAWSGSAWVNALAAISAFQNLTLLGVRTTADTTNRLAVKSDGALLSHDDVTPGTGNMRVTLNKSAAAKDASFTLQDAFSTRALFGLLGDDNFTIKVSADGSSFKTAIVIDKTTGHIGINCSPDANNWLAINADGVLFNKDASGDMRLTINKSAAGKDAGFTFQDNFSTRALFGLLGDDNFTIKVSPDGSAFKTPIAIDKTTGHVGINSTPDATAWLAVNADAILLNKDSSGDMKVTVNKSASNKEASLSLQDNFSTRLQLGLFGDDDFRIKVSPDGSAFYTALRLFNASGRADIRLSERAKWASWMPRPNTTTVDQSGLGATTTGTATAVALAFTNYFTQSPRVQFVSAAGAGSSAGLNGSSLTAWRGNASGLGGFYFNCRAGISTFQTNGRAFLGLYSSASVIGNVNPSTLLNLVGLSIDSGQTTWRFITNDGAGTATATDLGANFPANTSGVDMYDVSIWCEPNDTKIQYRIERLNTGNVATGTISSDMPTTTTFLTPHAWINNGTTAAGIVIDVVQTYLETMVP